MTTFSNFRKFFKNKKALELKIIIFENSSPKGILRQIMNDVPKWLLLQDSQCSQAGALNPFEWILKHNCAISALMHYLDDYFTVGPPSSPLCASQVDIMVKTSDRLGIPLAPDKLGGPSSHLVFLSILIDSTLMECSLTPDKLSELMAELHTWSSWKSASKENSFPSLANLTSPAESSQLVVFS